jgi:hypothetical protein
MGRFRTVCTGKYKWFMEDEHTFEFANIVIQKRETKQSEWEVCYAAENTYGY